MPLSRLRFGSFFLQASNADSRLIGEIGSHWATSLGLCGLYLILICVVKIPENLVDCETLLDQNVMAIGHGLAYSYFYGFLKMILPASEHNCSKYLPRVNGKLSD